jgi:heme oxygenase
MTHRSGRGGNATEDHTFSAAIRIETRAEHEGAEGSAFVERFVRGEVPRDGYAAFSAQLHAIYATLETAARAMQENPVAGPFVFDELTRVPALEADLAFLLGPDWQAGFEPLQATQEYCARLEEVCFDRPECFVAHHYTRYLGDLSGGQFLRGVAARTYNLDSDGLRFYDFPEITDGKAFKGRYRSLLDGAAFDDTQRAAFMAEVSNAYRLNGRLFEDLEVAFV